jgi:peroxiredoxin
MKAKRIELIPNDDGTFQIEIGCEYGDGVMGGYKTKRYSAGSLEEAIGKIKAGMEEVKSEKEDKPKEKRKVDKSMKGFLVETED